MPKTITIYLKYQSPNVMWRNEPSEEWKKMEPTSQTAKTTAGDSVVWQVSDDSIEKIVNIKVGIKNKVGSGYKWKDIWSEKPKKDGEDTKFKGVVSEKMYRGDADGYEISVQTKNDGKVTVDPGVDVEEPPRPGEGD